LDLTWLTAWVAHKCITLKAGTCNNSLPELDKSMFLDRDVLQVGFEWRTIYDGCTKSDWDKAKIDTLYVVHIIAEKKDHQLTCSLMSSLLASPSFGRQTSMEYRLAPTFSNDNGLAEHAKFLETLETHKYVQDKLASSVIPDLESLDLQAKQLTKQSAILTDDSAMAIAEKKNPTARQLLMKIWKKGMPGVSLFVDVGSFLATYPDTDDKG
jgi:hypothetical protein